MDEHTSMHRENNQLYIDIEFALNLKAQVIITSNQGSKRSRDANSM